MLFGSGSRGRHPGARLLAVLALAASCAISAPAHAACQLTFSTKSSDDTPAAVLTSTATFSVIGNQLQIAINNSSAYQIADLYFNADPSLTGLALVGGDAAWSVSGGAVQAQNAAGFGDFNYRVDFGNAQTFLGNCVTNLLFNMTGATTESAICSTFGANPSNSDNLSIAVMKFQSGPGDDSAFGATDRTGIGITGDLAPEGDSVVLLACGPLPFVFLLRRRTVAIGPGGARLA